MATVVELWDDWRELQRELGRDPLIGADPVDRTELERCEAAFWRRGFELDGALRELLEARGRVWVAPISQDGLSEGDGLTLLESVADLDSNSRGLELAELQGVFSAEHWLVFATDHGDVEPAWALDHRFGDGGHHGVGRYHQDDVCNHPVRGRAKLPRTYVDLHAWLAARLDEISERWRAAPSEQLTQAIARAGVPRDLRAERERSSQHAARQLAESAARVADGRLPWGRLDTAWGELLATTKDGKLLERVFDEVRRDRQHGRAGVRFDEIARGAPWPYDYPGPAQLCARLDEGQRRRLMAWAIARAAEARDVGDGDVATALAALRTGGELQRESLRRISFAGWTSTGRDGAPRTARAIDLETASGRRRYLSRAVALAFADADVHNVGWVLTMCARLGGPAGRFSLLDAWGHLEAVLRRGASVGEERSRAPAPAIVAELTRYLDAHPGPQRQLLDDLRLLWMPRMVAATPSDRAEAARALQRSLKSPKLADALAELLRQLG